MCALSHSVVSSSLWSRRLQPARLLCPWDSPGKNTGVGCHALLQGIFSRDRTQVSCTAGGFFTVWAIREAHSYTYENESRSVMPDSLWPLDYTGHGILQARTLEWAAFPFSRGSSQPRDWTQVSCIAGGFFTSWATREATYLYTPQNMTRLPPDQIFHRWQYDSGPESPARLHASPHTDSQPCPSPTVVAQAFVKPWPSTRTRSPSQLQPSRHYPQELRLSPRRSSLVPVVPPDSLQHVLPRRWEHTFPGSRGKTQPGTEAAGLGSGVQQPRSATVKHETLLNHSETQNSHNKNNNSSYHTRLIQSSNDTMHVKTGSSVVEHRK